MNNKILAIYYHMPYRISDEGRLFANPVMGIFVESLLPYFTKILFFGYEAVKHNASINYEIMPKDKLEFISLGPEGTFWDHFENKSRSRRILKQYQTKIDILLLRLPSYKAYAVWKNLGEPEATVQLFVGNPLFTSSNWYQHIFTYMFRKTRSALNDMRMRKISNRSTGPLIANSQSLQNVWGRILGKKPELVLTSSLSDADLLTDPSGTGTVKRPVKLLFVGRVSYEKGIRELLKAIEILSRTQADDYILHIVGLESDLGGKTLNQLIHEMRGESYIKYHGVIPFGKQLFQFYRTADIYILPSYHEGMPHTIWEAMSQGTPVIATPVGGVGDFFKDGDDLLFIKAGDVESIVSAVQQLVRDEQLYVKLSKNGLRRAGNVTAETQSKRIADLLERVAT